MKTQIKVEYLISFSPDYGILSDLFNLEGYGSYYITQNDIRSYAHQIFCLYNFFICYILPKSEKAILLPHQTGMSEHLPWDLGPADYLSSSK